MRKTLISFAIGLAAGCAATAQAGIPINFDLGNGTPGSLLTNQTSLDWNEAGSGVAIGQGPFGSPFVVGSTFDFLYQANLVSANPGGAPAGLDTSSNGVWNNSYEFTIVAVLHERVQSFTPIPNGCGTGCTTFVATFVRDVTQPDSRVSIFYDTATTVGGGVAANTATGAGFDDGLEVLRMTIDDGEPGFATFSSFTALVGGNGGGTGQGSAKIHGVVSRPGDFVDPNYLRGFGAIILDAEFQSNLNYPPGTSNTVSFHNEPNALYPVHPVDSTGEVQDLVLKVDGQNQFTTQVPEPATLLLLGGGLLGLGFNVRRRKAA